MKQNNPIFTDLSTYSPEKSVAFYRDVFEWEFYKEYDYYTAYLNNRMVAGLYETPEKFKQMRMPHFWMTYIQVNDTDKTVETAKEHGGIVELTDNIAGFGKIALIRDPKGAGFTVYQGNILNDTRTTDKPNTLIWNELHTSDKNSVIPFYKAIFNWNIKDPDNSVSMIFDNNNKHITDIIEIPNKLKSKYEYWISSFGVEDLQKSKTKIINNGGSLIIDEGNRILFTDNSGEAFFYISQI